MNESRPLVIDANVLMNVVFGKRARQILRSSVASTSYYTPDQCIADARKHVPVVAAIKQVDSKQAIAALEDFLGIIQIVDAAFLADHEASARARLPRDPDDWPIAAAALALECPIWTEDQDFFGCGIPIWNISTVELYLRDSESPLAAVSTPII